MIINHLNLYRKYFPRFIIKRSYAFKRSLKYQVGRNANKRPSILQAYDFIKGSTYRLNEIDREISDEQLMFLTFLMRNKLTLSPESLQILLDKSPEIKELYNEFLRSYFFEDKSQIGKPIYLVEGFYGFQDLIFFSFVSFLGYSCSSNYVQNLAKRAGIFVRLRSKSFFLISRLDQIREIKNLDSIIDLFIK